MVEATGITGRLITNAGSLSLYEVKATATTAETITIPSNIPVTSSSKIQIVGFNNVTDGTDVSDSSTYDDGNTRFTYTETGGSDEDVRILFYVDNS